MEDQVFTEVQDVLDFMNSKHDGETQVMTWGEMKKKFPKCMKMTTLFFESLEEGSSEDDLKDEWLFRVSDIFLDSLRSFESADNPKTMSKYFKCIINVFIDAVGDMVAEREGFDADTTEEIKIQSYDKFQKFHPIIDDVANKMFNVA